MKEMFTEYVISVICGCLVFCVFMFGIFYTENQNTLLKFHCRTAAIEKGYTASDVQVICFKGNN